MVTVREALPAVLAAVPLPSKRTYTSGLRQLASTFGDRELDRVGIVELRALRDSIEQHTGAHIVARAVERGRRLRSYDPQSFGQGAASNFVMAVRFFFRFAVDVGWLTSSPAEALKSPRRHPGLRRPLLPEELAEIWTVATTTGQDMELDELILTFLRHTAARREGSLNLTVGHVQPLNDRVLLSEKYGHTVCCRCAATSVSVFWLSRRAAARPRHPTPSSATVPVRH